MSPYFLSAQQRTSDAAYLRDGVDEMRVNRLMQALICTTLLAGCGGGLASPLVPADPPSNPVPPAPTPPPAPPAPPPAPAPSPTPPPLPSTLTPNLPSGAGLTLQYQSDLGNLVGGEFNADGLAVAGDWQNAANTTAPFSAPGVFRTTYAGGIRSNGDGGATLTTREVHRWKRLYASVAVFFPSDYSTHTLVEKFFYPVVAAVGGDVVGSNCICIKAAPGNGANGRDIALWLIPQVDDGGPGLFEQNNAAFIRKGAWQVIENYVVMNTPGRSDGVWRAWVNGVLVADHRNVRFAQQNAGWVGARFTGTRGGGASAALTPATGQYRDYDRVVVYAADN